MVLQFTTLTKLIWNTDLTIFNGDFMRIVFWGHIGAGQFGEFVIIIDYLPIGY